MTLEKLIAKHRPPVEAENQPCRAAQLEHLNRYGLMQQALDRQRDRDAEREEERRWVVITRIAAWEVLAEAQQRGLVIQPRRGPF